MRKHLFIFLVALCSVSSVAQTIPSYVPTSGLVGWWPFNGNAIDESINTNDGTVNGATLSTDRNGNSNSAYYFSSSGCGTRIDANINTSSITTGFTFSFWSLRSGAGCISPRLIEFLPVSSSGYLAIAQDPGANPVIVKQITSTTTIGYLNFNFVPNNVWSHYVYSTDGTNVKLYQDGLLINTIASNGIVSLASNASFGRMNHPSYDAHEGNLDDIGLWNRALTACEIQKLYIADNGLSISASSSTICSGQSINLTASGATNYLWSTGATSSSISINPNINTIYSVTTTYSAACSDTKTVSVTVNQTPTVAVNSATICSGSSANIIASGATSYNWDNGATTNSISVSPNSNTNYTVTGITNGCSDTKIVIVNVNQTPTVAVNSATICSGSSANIIASGATSYNWDNGAITNSISVSPNSNTIYTVTGITNGCSDTKTISVNVNPSPTVSVSNGTICSGNSFTINSTGAITYSYSSGSAIVSPVSTSTYTVTGYSSQNCASSPQTLTLTVNPISAIISQPTNQSVVSGTSAVFTVSATAGAALQWQTNLGLGFQNLSNAGQYSGVNTATLTVNNLSISNNNQTFRCIVGTSLCGDTSTVAILSFSPTGVEELMLLQNITLYPNPATSQVTIIADAKLVGTTYTICNYIGKSVIEGKINAEHTLIDLGNLSGGIYLISVGDHIKQTFKVIKQ